MEHPSRLISNAQNRVLGVYMFAQEYLDVNYDDIKPFFENWVNKVHTLEKKVLDK